MRFVSTRDPDGHRYTLAEALRLGPAPDGGLFVPERLEAMDEDFFADAPGRALAETGAAVLGHLLGDSLDEAAVRELAADALDFPIPLVPVTDRFRVLELFHGPTLAFKDVGARCLARFLAATQDTARPTTVLVATSGDTGGAVANAFFGVDGVRVAILYPRGQVSPLQERQLATLGGNVRAFDVDGAFDDCQRMVRAAFADRDLAERFGLTSANSINIGRLLPQVVYFLHALSLIPADERDRPLVFSVPSGNFGNLTAGLIARRLGLDARFVAATNVNDVVPEYLETGVFSPRASRRTISNAMDVGDPSNFERIRHLYGDDLDALRRDLTGRRYTDEETRETIARVLGEHGYLLDPHTAVGWRALEETLAADDSPEDGAPPIGIVLGTAHPAKFGEVVEPVIGRPVEIPRRLARHLDDPMQNVPLDADPAALRRALEEWLDE